MGQDPAGQRHSVAGSEVARGFNELNSAGGYAEIGISPNLPDLPLVEVQRFMDMRHGMGEIQWIRAFPQWVLENFPHRESQLLNSFLKSRRSSEYQRAFGSNSILKQQRRELVETAAPGLPLVGGLR